MTYNNLSISRTAITIKFQQSEGQGVWSSVPVENPWHAMSQFPPKPYSITPRDALFYNILSDTMMWISKSIRCQ